MKKQEKEELLQHRLLNLKHCIEIAHDYLKSAIENLDNLDDFNDLVNNWDKYKISMKDKV